MWMRVPVCGCERDSRSNQRIGMLSYYTSFPFSCIQFYGFAVGWKWWATLLFVELEALFENKCLLTNCHCCVHCITNARTKLSGQLWTWWQQIASAQTTSFQRSPSALPNDSKSHCAVKQNLQSQPHLVAISMVSAWIKGNLLNKWEV